MIRKGGEWMVAFSQVRVPIFTVIMRRSFGVAGNNYATPRGVATARIVWPAADVGGIPPEGGIEAARDVFGDAIAGGRVQGKAQLPMLVLACCDARTVPPRSTCAFCVLLCAAAA